MSPTLIFYLIFFCLKKLGQMNCSAVSHISVSSMCKVSQHRLEVLEGSLPLFFCSVGVFLHTAGKLCAVLSPKSPISVPVGQRNV